MNGGFERDDEPLTPSSRLFFQPGTTQVINCLVACKNPVDIDAVKTAIRNSILMKHPRFCSVMRYAGGRERWRRVHVNVDDHLIVHRQRLSDDRSASDEDCVNDFLADLAVSSPLDSDKPLWEFHLLVAHNCAVLRLHHSLGDGVSLMSMFLSCCRRVDDPDLPPVIAGLGTSSDYRRRGKRNWSVMRFLKVLWYTAVYVLKFVLRILWVKDKRTALSGGAGVELWPRKLATATFILEDIKTVKRAVPDATINDVLFGIISCGLFRYLEMRSSRALQEGLSMTGVAMVNLRPQAGLQEMTKLMNGESGSRWGNKFGIILLPINYHKGVKDPLQFVKRAKAMIDKKKLSLEALCSYKLRDLVMSSLGAKIASSLSYRIVCNTTFTISNVIGPREQVTIAGNPIDNLRVTSTCLPHAITMHMVSYAGKIDMQILVAKDIIPDPKVLARCFEQTLQGMKEAAQSIIETERSI
ncbi:O-acyltransferase WSD1-like [Ipomoea triloba]|uniref:O-acyltransferase WSD1-like n=1 Tax=Ipomoea triloba TaxID=35885 RepID=UPI00125DF03E|nr:O-acyltransferase WSD1-like [Ipomoea triloba]